MVSQRTSLYLRSLKKNYFFFLRANSSLQYVEAVCANKVNKIILGAGMMVLDN